MPQTEAEWIKSGRFEVGTVIVNKTPIRYAIVRGSKERLLISMVGGIPREVDRQRNLPLINKLYGHLALEMQQHGVSSLLYNQPGTGSSGGDWSKETLQSRALTLSGLVDHFRSTLSALEIGIIGSSSGAYIAVNAIEEIQKQGGNVTKLILLSPAAYPERIETVPYGPRFTQILHEPWDVTTSPVFSRLERFIKCGGEVQVCFFEVDDPPIPLYVQEGYKNLARELSRAGGNVSVITIPGVAHNFRKIERKRRENVVDENSIRLTAQNFLEFLI